MKNLAVIISASLAVVSTAAMSEVYVGGKIGTSWLDDACLSGYDCDEDSSVTLGGYVGYQAYDWLSFELGYDYLGEFSGAGLYDESVTAVTLAPRFSLPLSDMLSLYAKVGGAYADYGSADDLSYLGAVGLELYPKEQVSVRLEYQALTDINNDIVRAMSNTVTLGVSFKFGSSNDAAPAATIAEPIVEEVAEPRQDRVQSESEPEPTVVTKSYPTQNISGSNFDHDSAKVSPEASEQLDGLVTFLKENPQAKVEIVGHTDSSGSEEYNQKLSENRALAIADILIAKGIEESRMTIIGQGESNPIASNETAKGREQNRRVEVVVPEFEYQTTE